MPEGSVPAYEQAFETLRQFTRARRSTSPPVEHCELCSAGLAHGHPHLIEIVSRQMVCACDACALLFDGKVGAKYKRVSRRVLCLANFELSDGQWESLLIPINMAFFFRSSPEGRMVALYPSPAGAVESLLPLEAWSEIADSNPELQNLEPDIEALLVNRVGHAHGMARPEFYIAPIDECYKLVGLMRANWRGLSGGAEVWTEIADYFRELRSKAEMAGGGPNA